MTKDFDSWNNLKKTVNDLSEPPRFHEREIWWCTMGVNVGREQDGKHERFERPILVLKKFNRDTLWAIPLSSSPGGAGFSVPIRLSGGRVSYALVSQLRLISSLRLTRLVLYVDRRQFRLVKDSVVALLQG